MSSKPNSFDNYIIRGILSNNSFGIEEVNNIERLNARYFLKEEYQKIEKLIQKGDVNAIKSLPKNSLDVKEFLVIIKFNDQNKDQYIVTIYDSIELFQDPQVIDIFKL